MTWKQYEGLNRIRNTFKLSSVLVLLCLIGTVGAAQAQQPALRFVPLTPCRIADTRPWNGTGPFAGPSITALGSRSFPVAQSACSVPSTAKAYSLNVTVVPKTNFMGFLIVWPSCCGRRPAGSSAAAIWAPNRCAPASGTESRYRAGYER